MYKITLFTECLPNELARKIIPIGFKLVNGALVWGENSTFSIIPFGEPIRQNNKEISQGYRVYFKNSLPGGLYLYDMSMGFLKPRITGVEYNLTEIERSKEAWNFYFKSRSEYNPTETSGIYRFGNVGIVCMMDNYVNLQVRPKEPKGSVTLNQSLEEIACILEQIKPQNFSIFEYDIFEEVS